MGRGEPDPCHIYTRVAPVSTNQTSPHPSVPGLFSYCRNSPVLYRLLQKNSSGLGKPKAAQCNYTFLPDKLLHPSLVAGKAQREYQPLASPCHYCLCALQQRGSAFAGLKSFSGLRDPLMADASCRAEYLIHCILPQSRLS